MLIYTYTHVSAQVENQSEALVIILIINPHLPSAGCGTNGLEGCFLSSKGAGKTLPGKLVPQPNIFKKAL